MTSHHPESEGVCDKNSVSDIVFNGEHICYEIGKRDIVHKNARRDVLNSACDSSSTLSTHEAYSTVHAAMPPEHRDTFQGNYNVCINI